MPAQTLIFRAHAVQRMFERNITVDEVRGVIENGTVIRDYPDDTPYPSRLLLGRVNDRVLHVVAADIPQTTETVIITVYEPDAALWEADFTRRRQ